MVRAIAQIYGGPWTPQKSERVETYLPYFVEEFGDRYRTLYVDGFAGTGYVHIGGMDEKGPRFSSWPRPDLRVRGSACRALDLERPFDRYILVDKDRFCCEQLRLLAEERPHLTDRVRVVCRESNDFLIRLCERTSWDHSRAVFFLDPFGMQVNWTTVEAIARTEAADLWYVLPIGTINRRLKRIRDLTERPDESLTRLFGTDDWQQLYRETRPRGFRPGPAKLTKVADSNRIGGLFTERLRGVFPWVARGPLTLFNCGKPIFMLFFASAIPERRLILDVAQTILNIPAGARSVRERLRQELSRGRGHVSSR